MNLWLSMGLALAAFTALALGMERHQAQMLGRELAQPAGRRWQAAGTALLALSIGPCLATGGLSLAATVWLGGLTFAALALGLLLTYAPRRALPAAGLLGLAAGVGWLLA